MSNLDKKKKELPNANRMRQIKVGWFKKINTLENIIFECKRIKDIRSDVFPKAMQTVKDLNVPCIIQNFELITKYTLTLELKKRKQSLESSLML